MQKPADLQATAADSCASRLRTERERTGLTQAVAAKTCGAGQRTYSDWERGISQIPGNRLASLAMQGFDMQYILTGRRSRNLNEVLDGAPTAPGEDRLLDAYRRLADGDRHRLLTLVRAWLSDSGD